MRILNSNTTSELSSFTDYFHHAYCNLKQCFEDKICPCLWGCKPEDREKSCCWNRVSNFNTHNGKSP